MSVIWTDHTFTLISANTFSIRWFTSKCESKLCGHATLATTAVLYNVIGNMIFKLYKIMTSLYHFIWILQLLADLGNAVTDHLPCFEFFVNRQPKCWIGFQNKTQWNIENRETRWKIFNGFSPEHYWSSGKAIDNSMFNSASIIFYWPLQNEDNKK